LNRGELVWGRKRTLGKEGARIYPYIYIFIEK